MLDINLLRLCRERVPYFQLKDRIPLAAMDAQTVLLLEDFGAYYERFPKADTIDMADFLTVFRARHGGLKKEEMGAYEIVFRNLRTPLHPEKRDGVLNSLLETRMSHEMALAVESWNAGDLANIHERFREIVDDFEKDASVETLDYLRIDINDLLTDADEDSGLQWRLSSLRNHMRALRGGDFGILAGRPDQGKTTALASELTYIAAQLPEERPVLWLNNEGPGNRIYLRLIQAALGLKASELRALRDSGEDVTQMYADVVGDPYKIRIVDIHGLNTYAVENLIRQNQPGVVVYDMIDKIRGFADQSRTDLALEKMYDWARELCVKYDLVGIATSQISVEGDGLRYPGMSMLKDSKTGKQGACDFQIMLGSVPNDPGLKSQRFIGIPKNKLRRENAASTPDDGAVLFRPEIARLEDIKMEAL